MFSRYVEFMKKFHPQHLGTELTLFSDKFKTAGTCDRVMILGGKVYVMDIKTSNALHNHYWLQVAVYRAMMVELGHRIDGVAILWLNAKTRGAGKGDAVQGEGWQLLTKTKPADLAKDMALFNATYKLWLAENGELLPKNLSYQLSYDPKAAPSKEEQKGEEKPKVKKAKTVRKKKVQPISEQ